MNTSPASTRFEKTAIRPENQSASSSATDVEHHPADSTFCPHILQYFPNDCNIENITNDLPEKKRKGGATENKETTILIIDDDEAVLDMIRKVVQSSGYSSVFAASGAEALKLLSKDSFSMILLETDLKGVDGFQVLRQARWQKPDIPIIVISRRTGDSDTVYGLDSGADDYIPKPFNPVVLRARIRALLRRSAALSPSMS